MVLLIDTNVILDVLAKRDGYYEASAALWKLCEIGKVKGYISALSIANIIYVLRKELSPVQIEDVIKRISMIFEISELDPTILIKASHMRWKDFEDAVQYVTASYVGADYIISRNAIDFAESEISLASPADFLKELVL